VSPDITDEAVEIWFGPQHVSAHGWATKLTLVGDYIVECDPHAGYFHRSAEKVLEFRNFRQGALVMERLCMLEAFLAEYPYIAAVEEIAEIEVPDRDPQPSILVGSVQCRAWIFHNDHVALG
jgi:NADH:ubiquinone oxidoreductase subunit D